MELHVPHGPIRSLKDFLVHLGIVTIGILIALSLEAWVQAHHRSKMAAEALAGFRSEMAFNIGQVKDVVDQMPIYRKDIETEIAKLSATPKQGSTEEPIKYPIAMYQIMRSASWDTAIATQVVSSLSSQTVKSYDLAYTELRSFADLERTDLGYWYELHRYGVDPAALSVEERRALIEALRVYESSTYFLELIGNDTLKTCESALK